MRSEPICRVCHSNRYVVPFKLVTDEDKQEVDVLLSDNPKHIVELYACGKCQTLMIDNSTALKIKEECDYMRGDTDGE